MSRIGQMPIPISGGVKINIEGRKVTVGGPKGTLSQDIPYPITCQVVDNNLVVERPNDSGTNKAMHGLSRALLNNMVQGVTAGFEKILEISGVGYRAQLQGKRLTLQIGFSHPVNFETPEGVELELLSPTRIKVLGIDKQLVGEAAAEIRAVRGPEPYKGKGIRYAGEYIRRKAGKTGAK
ncbi:MAG: 50S ribosomal protein L6 [bacterium]|nr:50S ribosomal protein L6 [bacterium]